MATTVPDNPVIIQLFDRSTNGDGSFWKWVKDASTNLTKKGFTHFWLPPAIKGNLGAESAGYDTYDLWDLGEFPSKGTVRTKYGTKDEYTQAVAALRAAGGRIIGDVNINSFEGGDSVETATVIRVQPGNRKVDVGNPGEAQIETVFNFPGRKQADGTLAYNGFVWSWFHFVGIDSIVSSTSTELECPQNDKKCNIYRVIGKWKYWDENVSSANGNDDFAGGADIDFNHPDVKQNMKSWGVWYLQQAKIDGLRFDSSKHISWVFLNELLGELRRVPDYQNLMAIADYESTDLSEVTQYMLNTNGATKAMHATDHLLHSKFVQASQSNGLYDLRDLFDKTLASKFPSNAVTFVENHNTAVDPTNQVDSWFKPFAYAFILLRPQGSPVVFGRDYGIGEKESTLTTQIDKMVAARKRFMKGNVTDFLKDQNSIGWFVQGDGTSTSGLVVLFSQHPTDVYTQNVSLGQGFAQKCFQNIMAAESGLDVCADNSGNLSVNSTAQSVSVWVPKVQQNDQSTSPGGSPGSSDTSGARRGISTGALVGTVLGIICLFVLAIVGFFVWRRRQQRKQANIGWIKETPRTSGQTPSGRVWSSTENSGTRLSMCLCCGAVMGDPLLKYCVECGQQMGKSERTNNRSSTNPSSNQTRGDTVASFEVASSGSWQDGRSVGSSIYFDNVRGSTRSARSGRVALPLTERNLQTVSQAGVDPTSGVGRRTYRPEIQALNGNIPQIGAMKRAAESLAGATSVDDAYKGTDARQMTLAVEGLQSNEHTISILQASALSGLTSQTSWSSARPKLIDGYLDGQTSSLSPASRRVPNLNRSGSSTGGSRPLSRSPLRPKKGSKSYVGGASDDDENTVVL